MVQRAHRGRVLEFRQVEVNGRAYTKCQVRALAIENETIEPVYICDYLFVKDQYGFSISLLKKDDAELHQKELETFMANILEYVHFIE